ncbi:MAG: BlaI/MecI/CopY family transcriptional regulator [Gemmataceae bacterium]
MGRTPQDVTEKELAILQVLWDQGTATIRQITDIIYPGGETAQYATVQKLLDRLEEKQCVSRRKASPANLYSASIAREDLIGRRLEDMAAKLCGGSLTPLLTHLVRHRHLNAQERQELRNLIDELDTRGKS